MHEQGHATQLLRKLGLNQLESEVYTFLLQHPPMTAYRVGTQLGKPTANVYKAIESLARRGAVVIEEGGSRQCRAVPAVDFLGQLERGFLRTTQTAADVLSNLAEPSFDERVYRIESVDAVIEKACAMLTAARTVAVVDAFPPALARLIDAIHEAAERGVEVIVEAYAPVTIAGADVVVVPHGEDSLSAWRGEQLNLVVDGHELLIALFDADLDRVHQSIWSRSAYLACLLHGGMTAEHTLIKLRNLVDTESDSARMTEVIRGHRFFRDSEVPGHQELVTRLLDRSEKST